MASRIKNITIDQGTDYIETFVAYSDKSSTAAKDITDYTVYAQMRKSYYHANAALAFTATNENATSGVVSLKANNTQTSSLTPGRYVYDIEIASSATPPIKTRIIEGIVTVTPEATKAIA